MKVRTNRDGVTMVVEWCVLCVEFQHYLPTFTIIIIEAGDVQASFVQAVVMKLKHAFYKQIYRAVTGWCLL